MWFCCLLTVWCVVMASFDLIVIIFRKLIFLRPLFVMLLIQFLICYSFNWIFMLWLILARFLIEFCICFNWRNWFSISLRLLFDSFCCSSFGSITISSWSRSLTNTKAGKYFVLLPSLKEKINHDKKNWD